MGAPYPIVVTLDSVTPELKFTFKPDSSEIDPQVNKVQWTKGKGGIGFEFAALSFHEPNPYSNVEVKIDKEKNVNEINASDDNKVKDKHVYGVLVKVGFAYYNSRDGLRVLASDGPTIRNK